MSGGTPDALLRRTVGHGKTRAQKNGGARSLAPAPLGPTSYTATVSSTPPVSSPRPQNQQFSEFLGFPLFSFQTYLFDWPPPFTNVPVPTIFQASSIPLPSPLLPSAPFSMIQL